MAVYLCIYIYIFIAITDYLKLHDSKEREIHFLYFWRINPRLRDPHTAWPSWYNHSLREVERVREMKREVEEGNRSRGKETGERKRDNKLEKDIYFLS